VRALDPTIRELVLRRVRETAEGIAAGFGAAADVEVRPSYDPLINHDPMVDVVRENARRLVGDDHVTLIPRPSLGVEDFAFYVSKVPGAFYSLGVRNEERGIVHPVHHELFDVDEECLAYGVTMQTLNALTFVGPDAPARPGEPATPKTTA